MNISYTQALDDFVFELKARNRAEATILAYSKDIEQLLEFVNKQGAGSLEQIKTEQIKSFLKDLAQQDYTNKSISRKINSIKTFFKFLKEKGLIAISPAKAITHPKIQQKKPRILSPIEYRALRDAAGGETRTFAIVELLLQTGIRIGELARIKQEDIGAGELKVRGANGETERTISLNPRAQKAIEAYLRVRPKSRENNFFITKTGRPLLVRNIRSMLGRLFKIAGIEEAVVNDLRNTFIAENIKAGTAIEILAQVVGHKRVSTTERFLELVGKEEKTGKAGLVEL